MFAFEVITVSCHFYVSATVYSMEKVGVLSKIVIELKFQNLKS